MLDGTGGGVGCVELIFDNEAQCATWALRIYVELDVIHLGSEVSAVFVVIVSPFNAWHEWPAASCNQRQQLGRPHSLRKVAIRQLKA